MPLKISILIFWLPPLLPLTLTTSVKVARPFDFEGGGGTFGDTYSNICSILCVTIKLSLMTLLKILNHFHQKIIAEAISWNLHSVLLIATVVSSTLLLLYLSVLLSLAINLRARLARWSGWELLSQDSGALLLHTLPHYLAITRSTCEVK